MINRVVFTCCDVSSDVRVSTYAEAVCWNCEERGNAVSMIDVYGDNYSGVLRGGAFVRFSEVTKQNLAKAHP